MTNKNKVNNFYKELVKLMPNAIAPFSGIRVAAVIVTDKGVFKGVNYEDSIMSLSICAERAAMVAAVAAGMKKVYEVHILTMTPGMKMCGACRQMLATFATPDCKIYDYDLHGKQSVDTLGQLLPKATYLAKDKFKK